MSDTINLQITRVDPGPLLGSLEEIRSLAEERRGLLPELLSRQVGEVLSCSGEFFEIDLHQLPAPRTGELVAVGVPGDFVLGVLAALRAIKVHV